MRDGELEPGTIEDETRLVMENLGAVLAEAGASYDDVVRCGVFLADLDDFEAMNASTELLLRPAAGADHGWRPLPGSRSRSTASRC